VTVWIGTSGWHYDHWRRRFYPRDLPVAKWLEHYANLFATVESNNAFYKLPERRQFEVWAERTPDDFVMAVKVNRYITHVRRLTDPKEPVARFVDRIRGLGDKLGPVLLQLPPNFRCDARRLGAALAEFPADIRVAVEFRHDSWYVDEIRELVAAHRAALCLVDRRGPLTPVWRTTDWTYVRFHEGRASPPPCYGPAALATWASRLADMWSAGEDAWVYFDNDALACAPRDAAMFGAAVERAGLQPTRLPSPSSVQVG
jgi:uncharacterized protein YecE (DUF72 family)